MRLKVVTLLSSNELNLLFAFSLGFIFSPYSHSLHNAKSEQRVNNNENVHVILIKTFGFKGHT